MNGRRAIRTGGVRQKASNFPGANMCPFIYFVDTKRGSNREIRLKHSLYLQFSVTNGQNEERASPHAPGGALWNFLSPDRGLLSVSVQKTWRVLRNLTLADEASDPGLQDPAAMPDLLTVNLDSESMDVLFATCAIARNGLVSPFVGFVRRSIRRYSVPYRLYSQSSRINRDRITHWRTISGSPFFQLFSFFSDRVYDRSGTNVHKIRFISFQFNNHLSKTLEMAKSHIPIYETKYTIRKRIQFYVGFMYLLFISYFDRVSSLQNAYPVPPDIFFGACALHRNNLFCHGRNQCNTKELRSRHT